jgi:hypothetical protein
MRHAVYTSRVLCCAALRGGAVLYVCHARDVCLLLYLTHGTCLSVCLSICLWVFAAVMSGPPKGWHRGRPVF